MKVLKIGRSFITTYPFTLPEDAVTQTFGILAKRGVGKTYTAKVFAEEMIGLGAQVVIIDPTDVWWGLRASANGKAPGLPVYVFGGEHGDLPLDAAAGAFMADVVVEQRISIVLSLRHLSKGAQRRFVADFAERLYHVKGQVKYRTPLHLFIDEADFFAPQRLGPETARVFGAIDDIQRKGRNVGFGVSLISQRPATLNKDVLTQSEVLVVLRTLAPHDRAAVDEWIKAHDTEGRRTEFMASLASLNIGEAWIWSPGWADVFDRVQVRQAHTFDSSATPKPGEKRWEPKKLAPVDLAQLREQMAGVVKEAEANDPKKLQARVRDLEKQLTAAKGKAAPAPCNHETTITTLRGDIAELRADKALGEKRRQQAYRDGRLAAFKEAHADATRHYESQAKANAQHDAMPVPPPFVPLPPTRERPPVNPDSEGLREPSTTPVRQAPATLSTDGVSPDLEGIKSGAVRILRVLAAMGPLTRFQLGSLTGFTPTGGTFGEYMRVLRRRTFADEVAPGVYDATGLGIEAVGGKPPPPGHEEVMELWKSALKSGAYRMLEIIIAAGDRGVDGRALAEESGFTYGAGTYGEYCRQLRRNGLASDATGVFVATDVLFP